MSLCGLLEQSENFNKDRKYKYQTEVRDLRNTITKLKNTLKRFNKKKVDEAEEGISKLEDIGTPQSEQPKEKLKKSEHSLRDLWDTIKWTNTCIIGVSRKEKVKGKKKLI